MKKSSLFFLCLLSLGISALLIPPKAFGEGPAKPPEERLKQIQGWDTAYPGQAWAKEALGYVYAEMKEYEKAALAFRFALRYDPKRVVAWNGLGQMYAALKRDAEAIRTFEKAISLAPEQGEYFMLASLYERTKQPEKALATYRKGLVYKPGDPDLQNALGYLFFRSRDYPQALGMLDKTAREHPEKGDYAALGYTWKALKKPDKAREAFTRGLSFKPRDKDLLSALGGLDLGEEKTTSALGTFTFLLNQHPDNPDIWNSAAYALTKAEQPVQALRAFEKAAALAPLKGDYISMGYLQKKMGAPEKALEAFKKELALGTDKKRLREAWSASGYTLGEMKRFSQALEAFRQALLLEASAQTYSDFGFACMWIESFSSAREAFLRALKLDPRNPYALYNLGLLALRRGDLAEAKKRAEALQPYDPAGAKDLREQIAFHGGGLKKP